MAIEWHLSSTLISRYEDRATTNARQGHLGSVDASRDPRVGGAGETTP